METTDTTVDTGQAHEDAGGALCYDMDNDGLCDVCNVELAECGACGGKGYHRVPDCDDEGRDVIVTPKGRAAVAALRGGK